jgi:transcriptional regulator with XRE-family HTH domain
MALKPPPYQRKQYRRTFIRDWRKHRGLTLEQLAARIETITEGALTITASALSLLERGQSAYTQGTLEALAHALQTTDAALLSVDPNKEGEVVDLMRRLDEREREQALRVLKAFVSQAS